MSFVKVKSPKGVIVEVMPVQLNNFIARGFKEVNTKKPNESTAKKVSKNTEKK